MGSRIFEKSEMKIRHNNQETKQLLWFGKKIVWPGSWQNTQQDITMHLQLNLRNEDVNGENKMKSY